MSDRDLYLVETCEWVIGMIESEGPEFAVGALRSVADYHRQHHQSDIDCARIARLLGPARPVDGRVVPTAEPDRVTS
ncbi:MAG TPA: hypothetical protein PK478_15075 [Nitrospira sp.]|nr:hypothetical protein [Nitrospira sp.]